MCRYESVADWLLGQCGNCHLGRHNQFIKKIRENRQNKDENQIF